MPPRDRSIVDHKLLCKARNFPDTTLTHLPWWVGTYARFGSQRPTARHHIAAVGRGLRIQSCSRLMLLALSESIVTQTSRVYRAADAMQSAMMAAMALLTNAAAALLSLAGSALACHQSWSCAFPILFLSTGQVLFLPRSCLHHTSKSSNARPVWPCSSWPGPAEISLRSCKASHDSIKDAVLKAVLPLWADAGRGPRLGNLGNLS